MIKVAAAALLLALAACSEDAAEKAAPAQPANAAAPASPQAAGGRLVKEESELLEFIYGWPAEAAGVPKLRARFEADLARQRADSLAFAREDMAGRGAGAPFHGHYFSKEWQTLGDGGRLLSLAATIATFTGGAHPNSTWEAILWDRAADKEIDVADIFTDGAAAFAAMTPAWCAELDRQRAEKRGEAPPLEGPDWMVACRPLAESTVAPVDSDGDGRFDLMRVLVAPYEAGPYAEGEYVVDIPLTGPVLRLIEPGFGGAF